MLGKVLTHVRSRLPNDLKVSLGCLSPAHARISAAFIVLVLLLLLVGVHLKSVKLLLQHLRGEHLLLV